MKIVFQIFLATALAFGLGFIAPTAIKADGCYMCASGSSCGNQCRYGSSDTQDARKACEKRGCKITGTTSCSTAANVKVCKRSEKPAPWYSLQG
jgi:hypothetical protein